jgi:hypothetical protein
MVASRPSVSSLQLRNLVVTQTESNVAITPS